MSHPTPFKEELCCSHARMHQARPTSQSWGHSHLIPKETIKPSNHQPTKRCGLGTITQAREKVARYRTVWYNTVQYRAAYLSPRATVNTSDPWVKTCGHPECPRHGAFPISPYRCIVHLLAGLRNPRKAKVMVDKVIAKTCIPVPHNIERSMGLNEGGRKTSPCTSFHPLSS